VRCMVFIENVRFVVLFRSNSTTERTSSCPARNPFEASMTLAAHHNGPFDGGIKCTQAHLRKQGSRSRLSRSPGSRMGVDRTQNHHRLSILPARAVIWRSLQSPARALERKSSSIYGGYLPMTRRSTMRRLASTKTEGSPAITTTPPAGGVTLHLCRGWLCLGRMRFAIFTQLPLQDAHLQGRGCQRSLREPSCPTVDTPASNNAEKD